MEAREEAERLARIEAERREQEEAERMAKDEAERKAQAEADRLAKEQAEREAAEAEQKRMEAEEAEQKRLEAELKRIQDEREEAARVAKEKEEAERLAFEEAQRRAAEERNRANQPEDPTKDALRAVLFKEFLPEIKGLLRNGGAGGAVVDNKPAEPVVVDRIVEVEKPVYKEKIVEVEKVVYKSHPDLVAIINDLVKSYNQLPEYHRESIDQGLNNNVQKLIKVTQQLNAP
mmetsp:Transcript_126357/g.178355  ORF Transcript_126357/g.178355 Transcript_126357/m.178355 type:complete len:232 (+) Transcript_126357:594-1289(+)